MKESQHVILGIQREGEQKLIHLNPPGTGICGLKKNYMYKYSAVNFYLVF